jgi:RNA polymerase-binding transcription factor DksA
MKNTENYKKALEKEKVLLETELKSVGKKNPDNPKEWDAVPDSMDIWRGDDNEVADSIESLEENTAILKDLEIRYNSVKDALKRIADEKYGICKVCKEQIEEEKLEANPASETCKKHVNQ